ncbi:TadE/TadG family type IV pilus assembly protein [Streptomyces sp. NPDC006356]
MSYDAKVRGVGRVHGVGRVRRVGRVGRARGIRDRGQVAIEYLGFIPILILVAMAGVQLGLVAYAAQQAGTAARAGARAASLEPGTAQDGCANAISDWLSVTCEPAEGADEVTVTAVVEIPSIVPGWDFDPAQKTATMPLDY